MGLTNDISSHPPIQTFTFSLCLFFHVCHVVHPKCAIGHMSFWGTAMNKTLSADHVCPAQPYAQGLCLSLDICIFIDQTTSVQWPCSCFYLRTTLYFTLFPPTTCICRGPLLSVVNWCTPQMALIMHISAQDKVPQLFCSSSQCHRPPHPRESSPSLVKSRRARWGTSTSPGAMLSWSIFALIYL